MHALARMPARSYYGSLTRDTRSSVPQVMLYEFWHVFEERIRRGVATRGEQVVCCGCQFSLILFNAALLYLGIKKKFAKKKFANRRL